MAAKTNIKNITLIIGSGRFGASIANKYSQQGKFVMIVDNKEENFDRLANNFSGYTLRGDATVVSVLEKAHIDKAKEIIIATGDDNTNILVAHIARKIFDVPDIYVRLDDPESETLIKGLKVNAIYPFELSFDEFSKLKGAQK